ncbi:MAG: hypothetical protein H6R07_3371 [Proteobacteria bacterium]|nr:hypothetical protein [Pseudomonadota bacterium]
MENDVVYVKTAKGLEEIERRTCNLPRRLRSALIMIDGHASGALLHERFGVLGDPGWIIECLLAEAFIRPVTAPAAGRPSAPAHALPRSAERVTRNEAELASSGSAVRDLKCALNLSRCTREDCVMSRGCLKFNSLK